MLPVRVDFRADRDVSQLRRAFADGLIAGWNGLVATLNGIVIALGFLIPCLVVIGIAGLIVWAIVRAVRRRRAARHAAAAAAVSAPLPAEEPDRTNS